MQEEEKNIEFVDQKTEEKELRKTFLKDLITGSLLVRKNVTNQVPFMLYIVGLAIFYITNHYHAEKIYRTKMDLQNEIEEMRAESITTASELIYFSKRSEVNKMINTKGLDLKESRVPPIKIK